MREVLSDKPRVTLKEALLTTPGIAEDIVESVRDYDDPRTSDETLEEIRAWWDRIGIRNVMHARAAKAEFEYLWKYEPDMAW